MKDEVEGRSLRLILKPDFHPSPLIPHPFLSPCRTGASLRPASDLLSQPEHQCPAIFSAYEFSWSEYDAHENGPV